MTEQQKLPGMSEKKLDFFQQVKKLPNKSDRTMALLLTIIPEVPVTMSSKKLRKKVGTLSRSNKIKIVETYSHVFAKMRDYDLIQKAIGHHAYSLTPEGLKISKNKGVIVRFFTPQPPPKLPEKTETETFPKVTILENQIAGLHKEILDLCDQNDKLVNNHAKIIDEKDKEISKLEKGLEKAAQLTILERNVSNQYERIVDFMHVELGRDGTKVGNPAYGDQMIAIVKGVMELVEKQ